METTIKAYVYDYEKDVCFCEMENGAVLKVFHDTELSECDEPAWSHNSQSVVHVPCGFDATTIIDQVFVELYADCWVRVDEQMCKDAKEQIARQIELKAVEEHKENATKGAE